MKKIYIIAGEYSGDFFGSRLIKCLKNNMPEIHIKAVGGHLIQAENVESLFDISEINIMGFWEILPHIFRIKRLIKRTIDDILSFSPDMLVTIDSPGFTYRVAKEVRRSRPDIKLVHMVAPSVWAYKEKRAQKYANLYDHLLTLFPFENQYFEKYGLPTTCIGHPIFEQNFPDEKNRLFSKAIYKEEVLEKSKISTAQYIDIFEEHKLDLKTKPPLEIEFQKKSNQDREDLGITTEEIIISITPGSRLGEIKRHMPIIKKALDDLQEKYDNLKALFIQSDDKKSQYIRSFLDDAKFTYEIICDKEQRLKAFAAADMAIAKSGTNSFEIAACATPMIIFYRVHPVSAFLIRLYLKISYVCLINIIANKMIIPELLQENFNPHKLKREIEKIITSKDIQIEQVHQTKKVLAQIGYRQNDRDSSPSQKAAKVIFSMI